MRRLILAGGGHAHLFVLAALARRPLAGVEVVLVTPDPHQYYSGMLPGWISGHYTRDQCRIDLRPLTRAARGRLEIQRLVGMEADNRVVTFADGRTLDYDLLSLDTGSEVELSWLAAAGDKLLPARPLPRFFEAWPQQLAQARCIPGYRLLVVGGGAAGVELALAARHAFERERIDGRVILVTSESGPLNGHAKGARERIRRVLARAGIDVYEQRAAGTDQGVMLADGSQLPANCIIAAAGASAPPWLANTGLQLDEQGYVMVNEHHQSLSQPRVFAAGDVCARRDVTMARSGVHAVHAGPVLAANLRAALKGLPLRSYQPRRHSLYLLATGPRHAVASWGPISMEGKWVWYWKDHIDRSFIRRFSHDPA
ncbi:FAD-dependent oxidoreductase [Zobellella maritima]|uniref:FAD-dependent oxidoreductase n=1 Tax=Zobellella maritima TaxID=2059725 RepID=UPI000E305A44|nr:FAD-dependent oxidoreductase [Zobellella maritima]